MSQLNTSVLSVRCKKTPCVCSAPLRLPPARPRGLLPLLQEAQRDDRGPPEQEDLRRAALHQRRLRALRPVLRGRQHAQRRHRSPLPVRVWERRGSRGRPLQRWATRCLHVVFYSDAPLLTHLCLSISWSGQDGHSDWLLPDETLPLHGRWGHRLDQDLQARFCHRPTAELPGGVSHMMYFSF